MFYDTDQYEVTTGVETDELLAQLPIAIMKENIDEQVDNPLYSNVNYLNSVLEQYYILEEHFEDNPTVLSELTDIIKEFCEYILNKLNDKFDISFNVDEKYDDIISHTDIIYTFFIINYSSNMTNFLYSYINDNKKNLAESYDKLGKKKDVTTMNYKKQFKNKDDVIIAANLPDILNYIKGLYIEPPDFIDYVISDGNYEGAFIKKLIDQGLITGDFVDKYTSVIFDENDNVFDEIVIGIREMLFDIILNT
jgi:hypothetical protein